MRKRTAIFISMLILAPALITAHAWASCTNPGNAIEAENCLTGTPQSTWDIGTPPNSGTGDSSIQGFADNISVNVGQTINFKVNTNATSYHLDIYRMGYYQGNGARLVTTIQPSVSLPQNQPACLSNASLGLLDCGNWAVSASWTVPTTAVSGIYFARVTRSDTGGASHIVFIVRNDASTSNILFQASDTSWQAYNPYGGQNLYGCGGWNLSCRAYKVSYNRPFTTRDFEQEMDTWVFGNEYPMVRWLEANGYDVSYSTDTDTDRNGSLILKHKVWMSNGHDEYWSGNQRANIEAARAAGVHLAFFSGNTMFWKTRWENSVDGTNTPYRTLVCYKETNGDVTDPADPPTWTGTWRDPTKSPPADGGKPENAVKGNIFRMNGGQDETITVPAADGKMRFWRNTSVASLGSGSAALAPGTIGPEFDDDEDNGFRPAGLIELSALSVNDSNNYLLDYGVTYGAGTAVHKVVMYKYSSGAIVFSTGTYRWAWGLDSHHDDCSEGCTTSQVMQQATVNLFADMGVQPVSLQSGLVQASASTDTIPPTSTITSPAAGAVINSGSTVTVTGTAADTGGGVVGGVEVSVDGGTTWHPASGRASWTYTWTAKGNGTATIRSRAVDDSGNLENPSAGVTVSVGSGAQTCPCTIFGNATPATPDSGPDSAVNLGVRFESSVAGSITGIRFYKSATNTGTHVGTLWSNTGSQLASATFTGETASGWQTVTFSSPVTITANTPYVASYFVPSGHYSEDDNFFTSAYANPPLEATQDGSPGVNGVYLYSSGNAFPTQAWESANYYVDVVFSPTGTTPGLSSVTVNPASVTGGNSSIGTVTLTAAAPSSGLAITVSSDNAAATPNPSSFTIASGQTSGTFTVNTTTVTASTTAHITASGGNTNVQATLTITPAASLSSVTVNPASVVGGNGSTGTVTLTYAATVPGVVVNLASDNAAAVVPSTVTVAAGSTTATFAITTTAVSSAVTAHISGTYNSVTPPAAALTINPLTLSSVSLNPATVVGPNSSTGTVTLSGATTSSISVSLGSNSSSASVPASVTVAANASSATFPVTTLAVSSSTQATITATYGASNAQATLTINPPALASVSMNPTSVVGGNPSTGTVTLTGPAPASGLTVSLQSTTGASVPSSVTVAANATSATFTVTTTAVASTTTATITASYAGVNQTATLTVTPSVSLAIDKTISTDSSKQATSITSPTFSTTSANELLLAFVATDATSSGVTVTGVTGASLTWSLVKRTNAQLGTAEIWRAFAPTTLSSVSVKASLSQSVAASITVVTFAGVNTSGSGGSGAIGATGSNNANPGAPSASLTTTQNGSLVFGVGNDWDNGISRTVPSNQTMVHQYLATVGDTYWVQRMTSPTSTAGTVVTINDTAPTTDRYNLSIVEVMP